MNTNYEISNEIKDELQIGIYCLVVAARDLNNKKYKICTLHYLNYVEHILNVIKKAFDNKLVYDTNSNFIDEKDLKEISFNMFFILLHHNSKGALFNYVTSIFEYEYAFNILTNITMLENDLNMFLESDLNMEFFVLDIFNIHKHSLDLIVRGR